MSKGQAGQVLAKSLSNIIKTAWVQVDLGLTLALISFNANICIKICKGTSNNRDFI